jgi:hypothetical protein
VKLYVIMMMSYAGHRIAVSISRTMETNDA